MPPRLKVFVTSDGLTDFAVATSSKAKALAAWGVRQDVFKDGQAHETDDLELVAATTARPGEVLRRPATTRDQLANLKPAKRSKPAKLEPAKPPAAPKGPSQAALRKISDLEARLAALDAGRKQAEAELDRDRDRLERRAEALAAEYAEKRKKLEAALSSARWAPG